MSAGIRSGVNWIRWNFRWKIWAIERTSSVLARPGAPVIRQCPPANRLISSCSIDLLLADDHLAELALDPAAALADLLDDLLLVLVGVNDCRHDCSLFERIAIPIGSQPSTRRSGQCVIA